MPEERTSGTKRKKTQNARTLLTSSRIQRLVDRRTVARSKPVDTTASDAAGGYAVPFKELGNNGEVLLLPGSPTFFPSPLCSTVSSVSSRNSNSRRSQGKSFFVVVVFVRSLGARKAEPAEPARRGSEETVGAAPRYQRYHVRCRHLVAPCGTASFP